MSVLPMLDPPRYRREHGRPPFEIVIQVQRFWQARMIKACRQAIRRGCYLACDIEGRWTIEVQDRWLTERMREHVHRAVPWK